MSKRDRKEGTVRISKEQAVEIFRDYLGTEVLQIPNDYVIDVSLGHLCDYGTSEINYVIRHEDDKDEDPLELPVA
jgi:hypothetical protein